MLNCCTHGTGKWRGYTISYKTAGCGEPILLVHGFGLSSFHYRHQLRTLGQKYKVRGKAEWSALQWRPEGVGGMGPGVCDVGLTRVSRDDGMIQWWDEATRRSVCGRAVRRSMLSIPCVIGSLW